MNSLIMAKMFQMRAWMQRRKGQNTVEYLLMLAVVVGILLAVGTLMKRKLPDVFNKIQDMIMGATDDLGK